MSNDKTIHQLNQEQEARIKERGETNAKRKLKKAVKRGELSGTSAGLNMAAEARDAAQEAIEVGVQVEEGIAAAIEAFIAEEGASKAKTPSGWLRQLKVVPPKVTAELALRVVLDAVGAQFR